MKQHRWPILVLIAAQVTVFARLFFADADGIPYRLIPWDFRSIGAPWLIYGWDMIREGFLPLWCPYAGGGVPFFVNPQTQVYSPLALLFGSLFGYSYRIAQIHSMVMMAIGGVGAYALSYSVWRNRYAALLTGLCFQLSSTLFSHLEHLSILSGYALAPWVFWAVLLVADRRSRWGLPLLAGLIYWLMTAVYLGVALMLMLWAAAFAVALVFRLPLTFQERLRRLTQGVLATLLGFAMAALNWLPFLLSSDEYTRGKAMDLDYVLDASRSLAPKHLWGLVYSFLTTHPIPGGDIDISMRGLYFGTVAVVLAVACLIWVRGWIVKALFTLTLGSLLMAFGGNFFLRVALHIFLPFLNLSRFPAGDSRFLAVLALTVLVGGGALLVARREEPSHRFVRRAYLYLMVFYLVSLFGMTWLYGRPIDSVLSTVSFEAFCMLLALFVLERRQGLSVVVLLGGITLLEIGYCVTVNFSPAGWPISAAEYAQLTRHVENFPGPGFRQPRVGDASNLGAQSSSEAYAAKKFYINDYNPLRLTRLQTLADTGFIPWMKTGPRVVSLPPESKPRNFAEFSAKAKPAAFSIREFTPNRVRYQIDSASDALLVFNEVYFPGWKATVDGAPVPVEPLAGGLRSLALKKGSHRVWFYFRPPSFFVALGVSLASSILFTAWLVWLWRRREEGEAAPAERPSSPFLFEARDSGPRLDAETGRVP